MIINEPPLNYLFSTRRETNGSLDQHCPIGLAVVMEMFYKLPCLTQVATEHSKYG